MVAINIKAFRGQVPRLGQRLQQPSFASVALNCKITAGRLDPLGGMLLTHTSQAAAIQSLFRYRHFTDTGFEDNWLVSAADVDFVTSPLANDTQGKFYFTGEAIEPRMSTYSVAIASQPYPSAWYALGVPSPTVAPTVNVTGGVAPTETRAYACTFVTALGEESGPSPASDIVTGNANGTWALTNLQTAPANSGTISAATSLGNGRVRVTVDTTFGTAQYDTLTLSGVVGMTDLNGSHRVLAVDPAGPYIEVALQTAQTYTSGGTWTRNAPINTTGMTKRIYRSAGLEGQFLYVDEIAVATTTYNDTKAGTALGELIPTLNTLPPPKNLTNLITLPNGCLVGLAGNELCFSDPYMPYSWPMGNRYSFSGHGVALAEAGNSVIVLTDSFPILFTGSDPEAMSPTTMETYAPCVAKRGVVNVGGGALYPSFDGLWLVAPGRVEKLTARLYREEEWKLVNPHTFVAAFHDGQYYACYDRGDKRQILLLNIAEPDSVVQVDDWADVLYRNEHDGELYAAKGNKVYRWDAQDFSTYTSEWKSVTMQLPRPTNFAVAQVHAEFGQVVPPDMSIIEANEALLAEGEDAVAGHLNGQELLTTEINGSFLLPATVATEKKVQFTLYADGAPVFTKLVSSTTLFRLPAGYRSELFNVGLSSSIKTFSVTVAESTAELAQASA